MFTELSKEVKFAIPLANSTFHECLRALVTTIYYTSHKDIIMSKMPKKTLYKHLTVF